MAEMYHAPPPNTETENVSEEKLPIHLPSASEMTKYEQGQTDAAQVQHDVTTLKQVLGLDLPSDADLEGLVDPDGDSDTTKRKLLTIHRELRRELATVDRHLPTGLDIGRMLADTVLLPDPKTSKTLKDQFEHFRLTNAYGWLDDLHTLLPVHASDAVTGSLKKWEKWVKDNQGVIPTDIQKDGLFSRTLHHQGETWRRLLCGEKQPLDLLSADDYKKAGDRVAQRFLGLVGKYIVNWRYTILIFLAIVGGTVFVVVHFAPKGPSTVAALIATAAGSLGVSWKTVASTLGRVTSKAEGPLWEAEVKEAIVLAATRLPSAPKVST